MRVVPDFDEDDFERDVREGDCWPELERPDVFVFVDPEARPVRVPLLDPPLRAAAEPPVFA